MLGNALNIHIDLGRHLTAVADIHQKFPNGNSQPKSENLRVTWLTLVNDC